NNEQIEDAEPDEKEAADPDALIRIGEGKQDEETDEVQNEEAIGDGNEAAARQARYESRIERMQDQRADKSAGEEKGEVLHAARQSHLVADRAQDVIGGEDQEEISGGKNEGGDLALADINRALRQAAD